MPYAQLFFEYLKNVLTALLGAIVITFVFAAIFSAVRVTFLFAAIFSAAQVAFAFTTAVGNLLDSRGNKRTGIC